MFSGIEQVEPNPRGERWVAEINRGLWWFGLSASESTAGSFRCTAKRQHA